MAKSTAVLAVPQQLLTDAPAARAPAPHQRSAHEAPVELRAIHAVSLDLRPLSVSSWALELLDESVVLVDQLPGRLRC